jgi:glucokinase
MTPDRVLGLVADIGGTHARFAIARSDDAGRLSLDDLKILHTGGFPSLDAAVAAYCAGLKSPPRRAAFAVAGPLAADEVKLTNSAWHFRQSTLKDVLGFDAVCLINDFAAIAHALPHCPSTGLRSLTGAGFALPQKGVVSIVGPGTGLGVGLLLRRSGEDIVLPSEGGHIGFAPPDEAGIALLHDQLARQPRLSAERVLCGDGLALVYEAMGAKAGADPVALWETAMAGGEAQTSQALDRWLYLLGMFSGDIALAHGAAGLVMAGGILPRLGDRLDSGAFLRGLRNKGRFSAAMAALPVALLTVPQPGLLGAGAVLKAMAQKD